MPKTKKQLEVGVVSPKATAARTIVFAALLVGGMTGAACSSSDTSASDDNVTADPGTPSDGGGGDGSLATDGNDGTDSGIQKDAGHADAGTDSGLAKPDAGSMRQSWAWIYTNWTSSATAILAHASSVTHVSPTFYDLNQTTTYTGGVAEYWNCSTSAPCKYEGLTPAQYTAQFNAVGIKVVPAIYAGAANGGTDASVQAILNDANGEATSFISAMVTEAVTQGYAGYNLDWELSSTGSAYADKFVTFVNQFKAAMAPHGLVLSVDAIDSNINGTYCSSNNGYLDFGKLSASAVDSILIEDYTASLGTSSTSCRSVILSASAPVTCPLNAAMTDVTFTGLLDFMCSNLPNGKIIIGLQSDSTNTNPIAGSAISTVESYGFTGVAVWPQVETSDFMSSKGLVATQSDWWSVLSDFLAE